MKPSGMSFVTDHPTLQRIDFWPVPPPRIKASPSALPVPPKKNKSAEDNVYRYIFLPVSYRIVTILGGK